MSLQLEREAIFCDCKARNLPCVAAQCAPNSTLATLFRLELNHFSNKNRIKTSMFYANLETGTAVGNFLGTQIPPPFLTTKGTIKRVVIFCYINLPHFSIAHS